MTTTYKHCLFFIIIIIISLHPSQQFLVMQGMVILGLTSTKQDNALQWHNTVPPVRLEGILIYNYKIYSKVKNTSGISKR